MQADRIQLCNFRNLQDTSLSLISGTNWFAGQNGQGKTNLIEALYFGLSGKSFRTNQIRDLARNAQEPVSVDIDGVRNGKRIHLSVHLGNQGCVRKISGKAVGIPEFLASAGVMAFTAIAKQFVEGSPEFRRKFIDQMICLMDVDYLKLLSRYRRIVSQCREVLRKGGDRRVYQSFKMGAVPLARNIVQKRVDFLHDISESTDQILQEVLGGSPDLSFVYHIRNCRELNQYEKKMADVSIQEVLHRRQLMGPQLDDVQIQLKSRNARNFASSGQVRAIVLSLLLSTRKACLQKRNYLPILLLDDIDAELDLGRLERLLIHLRGGGQALLTTSKYGIIPEAERHIFHVHAGRISSERTSE